MKATITLEFPDETLFEEALVEAIRLATKLDVYCDFMIDDIWCTASEDSSIEEAVVKYKEITSANYRNGADAYINA